MMFSSVKEAYGGVYEHKTPYITTQGDYLAPDYFNGEFKENIKEKIKENIKENINNLGTSIKDLKERDSNITTSISVKDALQKNKEEQDILSNQDEDNKSFMSRDLDNISFNSNSLDNYRNKYIRKPYNKISHSFCINRFISNIIKDDILDEDTDTQNLSQEDNNNNNNNIYNHIKSCKSCRVHIKYKLKDYYMNLNKNKNNNNINNNNNNNNLVNYPSKQLAVILAVSIILLLLLDIIVKITK